MICVEGRASIESVDAFLSTLSRIGATFDCTIQAFDARYVAGDDHLSVAVARANRSFDRGVAIANDLAIEILLFAAGRRQISDALTIGVKADVPLVAIVIDGDGEEMAASEVRELIEEERVIGECRDDQLICDFFNITAGERSAASTGLEPLVIERVALLEINK